MKTCIGKTLLALLLLVSLSRALARDSFTLEVWDSERGLPNSTVTGIAQSPDGYLWISTINGLARFDGVRFVSFAGPAQAGLRVGGFNQIVTGKSGEIWARMENGQLVASDKSGFSSVMSGVSNEVARMLWTALDRSTWATTDSGAIARCANTKVERLLLTEKYGGLACAPVALPDGKYWFVTLSGALLECGPEGVLREAGPTDSEGHHWYGILKDAAENIWLW
jgi:hypothetical protein